MTKFSQSTVAQGLNELASESGTEIAGAVRFLPVSPDKAVRQALTSQNISPKNDSGSASIVSDNRHRHSRYDVGSGIPADLVANLPPLTTPQSRMVRLHPLQEWEGYVVAIEADDLVARLVDVTAGSSHESEEAMIPLAEISEHDAGRIGVGSIFRWVIGYERSPEGSIKRVSQIVFRDLPRMTEADLQEGREWAQKIASSLNR